MIDVTVTKEEVEFEIHGSNKLWALKSQLTIPLKHIKSVKVVDDLKTKDYIKWDAAKTGTFFPRAIAEGTFYQEGEKLFVNFHEGKAGIVLALQDDNYYEIIVEVDTPEKIAEKIQIEIEKLAK